MVFLVLVAVVVIFGFVIVQKMDERRWQRYQFERDMFFRSHPLVIEDTTEFSYQLKISYAAQRKIITEQMLKPTAQPYYKKVCLQRVPESQHEKYMIDVMLKDIKIGQLDYIYAQQLGQYLEKTDFKVGRPIEVLSEILVIQKSEYELGCQIRLNLPADSAEIEYLEVKEQSK